MMLSTITAPYRHRRRNLYDNFKRLMSLFWRGPIEAHGQGVCSGIPEAFFLQCWAGVGMSSEGLFRTS